MANYTANNTNLKDQGAQPTERSENERVALADNPDTYVHGEVNTVGTGEAYQTENSENERIATRSSLDSAGD